MQFVYYLILKMLIKSLNKEIYVTHAFWKAGILPLVLGSLPRAGDKPGANEDLTTIPPESKSLSMTQSNIRHSSGWGHEGVQPLRPGEGHRQDKAQRGGFPGRVA